KFKHSNTFAANISDMLSDSFFISDGLIGDFAKKKINNLIIHLNELLEKKNDQQNIEPNIGNTEEYKKIIHIIDEPIIKSKLMEMYLEVYGDDERLQYLKEEKLKIDSEIEKLTH